VSVDSEANVAQKCQHMATQTQDSNADAHRKATIKHVMSSHVLDAQHSVVYVRARMARCGTERLRGGWDVDGC
jgi:hypothetical protein